MPTLIRLLVFLIVLAGLGFAGVIALTVMVDPGEKDITIKIPTRDLTPAGVRSRVGILIVMSFSPGSTITVSAMTPAKPSPARTIRNTSSRIRVGMKVQGRRRT